MSANRLMFNTLRHLAPRVSSKTEQLLARRFGLLRPSQRILQPQAPRGSNPSNRSFTSTCVLQKKKSRADREAIEESRQASKGAAAELEDPFDFSTLNSALDKNQEKLKNDLSKLRTGGRFNPQVLEDLRVHLIKESKQTERLGDLAQVLPKGRTISVLVGEKEHIKPITSAIQASPNLNLQPVPDTQNPLALNVPIPPPTKESRDAALAAASKAGDAANLGVKNARATCHKRLRAMELKKVVRPDDLRKAGKEMEKIVEKAGGEVKKAVDAAKKAMEQQ